jgi:hypothetical protein
MVYRNVLQFSLKKPRRCKAFPVFLLSNERIRYYFCANDI